MIIDIAFALVILMAFYTGYKKGLIYSVLSFVAIFLGILLAMNFSSFAAAWLNQSFNIPTAIMPILSFVLVVIAVILAVKLVAYIVETVLKAIMLNFFNRAAGGALWGLIAALLFSTCLWLIDRTGVMTESFKADSITVDVIMPFGPSIFDYVGELIPLLKNAFFDLNETIKDSQHE